MLVPFIATSPPPVFADRMFTPGAASCDIVLEKFATSNLPGPPWASAATEMTPRLAAGSEAAIVYLGRSLSLPVAATTTAVSSSAPRISTICISASKKRRLER